MRFPHPNENPLVIKSLNKTQESALLWRSMGQTIGFVPTMGCLHDGHLSLIRAAREQCDRVIVSIFVNPLQFGKNEDFGLYPRPFGRDLEKCKLMGVDLVFHPDTSEFYSRAFATRITSGPLGKLYCGKSRPGFFDGVLTVVNILFHLTQPHRAYFGEKDFQQLHLIKQLVRDFRFPIEIIGMPIVREQSGLAMSSRNEYLAPAQRDVALCLHEAISRVQSEFRAGDNQALSLLKKAEQVVAKNKDFTTDYLHIVDENSLIAMSGEILRPARLLVAGYLGNAPRIRLIDNARIN